ncbi:MAG: hypothetical protein AB1405_09035, partial [Bdellovibrionota bacterium]
MEGRGAFWLHSLCIALMFFSPISCSLGKSKAPGHIATDESSSSAEPTDQIGHKIFSKHGEFSVRTEHEWRVSTSEREDEDGKIVRSYLNELNGP